MRRTPTGSPSPWRDKVVVVTGHSSGIGRAAAEALAAAGARVVGLSRSTGGDVTDAAALRRALSGIERVDALIAGAGLLGPRVPIVDCPPEDWDRVMAVNVTGIVNVLRAVAAKMTKDGVALVLSSGAGIRPRAGGGVYAVSKAAVEALCRIAAAELPFRVISVNPGPTRTPMRKASNPDEDPATVKGPEVVAKALLDLATSGETGRTYEIGRDGSLS